MAIRPIPRGWQAEQLSRFDVKRPRFWLTEAGTGAGKTYATCFMLDALKKTPEYKDAFIVVFCPLSGVVTSWQEALEFKREKGQPTTGFGFPVSADVGFLDRASAYVSTYAGVSDAMAVSVNSTGRPVLLVLDEIHRLEERDENGSLVGWSANVQHFIDTVQPKHVFSLTATPWREGDANLPFVTYDENDKVVADFRWPYSAELQQKNSGVVRVAFRGYHATATRVRGRDEAVLDTAQMDEYDPASGRRPEFGISGFVRARTYADVFRNGIFKKMLHAAHDQLCAKRKIHNKVKGLVICESVQTARNLCEYIQKEIDPSCALIVSTNEATETVASFRGSDTKWCVSVGMLAEGVDVKTIKVVVDFSKILTLRDIIQRWGRAFRTIPEAPGVEATVLFIKHSMLLYVARHLEQEIAAATSSEGNGTGGGGGGGGGEEITTYRDQDGEAHGAVLSGGEFDQEVAVLADWMFEVQYGNSLDTPLDYPHYLQAASIIYSGHVDEGTALPAAFVSDKERFLQSREVDTVELTMEEKRKIQRQHATELVGKLAREMYPDIAQRDLGLACKEVNKLVKYKVISLLGVDPQNKRAYTDARMTVLSMLAEDYGLDASGLAA